MMCRRIKRLAAAMAAVGMMAAGAFADDTDTAYVPFIVNVDATITAVSGVGDNAKTVTINVTGNEEDTLPLPLGGKNSAWNVADAAGRLNAPAITNSRGNITLRLPAQSYRNAEISLHAVNGKRILRGKAAASEAVSGVSRRNVAAGVYMLSVRGINGSTFTTRLTHSGGKMNINVAFGAENASPLPSRQLGKKAEVASGNWEITVSAVAAGYADSVYTFSLATWDSLPQVITLVDTTTTSGGNTFTDSRDGKIYKKVTIGEQVWMAENLNYDGTDAGTEIGACYNDDNDNCDIYGRLYTWADAMAGEPSSSSNPSGVQGACPAGWHLPSQPELTVLADYVGGLLTAGTHLKSEDGWTPSNSVPPMPPGDDAVGFSGLPGGWYSNGRYRLINTGGYWWTAANTAGQMSNNSETLGFTGGGTNMASVRCVLD